MDPAHREWVFLAYDLFENLFRAVTVILGSLITVSCLRKAGTPVSNFRRTSLIAFSLMAFVFLILIPLASGFWQIYSALMPFPWSALPLQMFSIIKSGKSFGLHYEEPYGLVGYRIVLYAWLGYQALVLLGTVVLGRRWQCSMICLYNGCHAESLGLGMPLVGVGPIRPGAARLKPSLKKALRGLQAVMFGVSLVLTGIWTLLAFWKIVLIPVPLLVLAEIIKLLLVDLVLMMALWVFVSARGYCYYCPAGLFLGLLGKAVGQRIETNRTSCTGCGACSDACPMSIDVAAAARNQQPVTTVHCTGCGHCVDACPVQNLQYATRLYNPK